MKKKFLAGGIFALLLAMGCELVTDFDRTKILEVAGDASNDLNTSDSPLPLDSGEDAVTDGSTQDVVTDANPDVKPSDTGTDTGFDAGADTGADADAT